MIEKHFRSLKRFIYWIPAIAWMGMIFFFSSLSEPLPGVDEAQINFLGRGAHLAEYAGLAFWLYFGQVKGQIISSATEKYLLWLPFAGAALFAVTDEFHQLFVPGRNFRFLDLGIDILGAGFVVGGIWWKGRVGKRREASRPRTGDRGPKN